MAFNPAIHTATNKPIGLIGKPVDARTYYYDAVNFVYRAYVSTAEVIAYLNTSADRIGQFSIIINTGGSLSAGVITGGTNLEWWFKDGVLDANLVLKGSGGASFIEQDITGGTTTIPQTIAHPGMAWPTVIFRDMSGNTYGGALSQDNGTSIIVTGDSLDGTTFAESFKVIIKP